MSMEKVGTTPSDLRASRKDELATARTRLASLKGSLVKTAADMDEIDSLSERVTALERAIRGDE